MAQARFSTLGSNSQKTAWACERLTPLSLRSIDSGTAEVPSHIWALTILSLFRLWNILKGLYSADMTYIRGQKGAQSNLQTELKVVEWWKPVWIVWNVKKEGKKMALSKPAHCCGINTQDEMLTFKISIMNDCNQRHSGCNGTCFSPAPI